MEPQYQARFSPEILAEAARRYGAAAGAMQELDGFESFIYAYSRAGAERILRIGHSHRRPERLVQGEAEWLRYLHRSGCDRVAMPIESLAGNLTEAVADGSGEHFIATAFEKAPGRHLQQSDYSPVLFETWGALLGRIHALSAEYRPRWPRPHWDDPQMIDAPNRLPPSEDRVRARYQELRAHLDQLPRSDPRHYGMIHQDAHAGNFFILPQADGAVQITLFDFDDCCYAWYAYDVAMVLFYVVIGQPDPAAFAREFLRHFLRGYRREQAFSAEWLAELPNFLKLREIDLYAEIHRSFDVTNLTHPWVKRYMDGRKERLEAGVPYLAIDFTAA